MGNLLIYSATAGNFCIWPRALPAVPRIARAQAYPRRQVRIIVGYPPGGSADVVARAIWSLL